MIELIREVSDWVLGFADSDWSALALAINSFAESIFSPIPPDPLLIGIAIRRPELAIWLAALTTVSSVAGAIVGYWLGRRLGKPLFQRLVPENRIASVERLFQRYGAWAVLVAAFTPIPYKVFAIGAGVLGLNLRTFIVASLIGRGARFFMLGGLLFAYGESIEEFIDANFGLLTLAGTAALGVGLVIVYYLARHRRARDIAS